MMHTLYGRFLTIEFIIGKLYNKMKRYYTKPTVEAVPLTMDRPLLAGSVEEGVNATISGYQSSEDDSDGFSQESLWN